MDPQTFDIRTSRDLIAKLDRELKRMNEGSREDRADAAFNFAVTVWATVDWIWRDIQKKARAGVQLSPELKPFADAKSSNPLKEFLAGPKTAVGGIIPEVKYCQVIANASKHGSTQESVPPIDVAVSAVTATSMSDWENLADVVSIGTGEMV